MDFSKNPTYLHLKHSFELFQNNIHSIFEVSFAKHHLTNETINAIQYFCDEFNCIQTFSEKKDILCVTFEKPKEFNTDYYSESTPIDIEKAKKIVFKNGSVLAITYDADNPDACKGNSDWMLGYIKREVSAAELLSEEPEFTHVIEANISGEILSSKIIKKKK